MGLGARMGVGDDRAGVEVTARARVGVGTRVWVGAGGLHLALLEECLRRHEEDVVRCHVVGAEAALPRKLQHLLTAATAAHARLNAGAVRLGGGLDLKRVRVRIRAPILTCLRSPMI